MSEGILLVADGAAPEDDASTRAGTLPPPAEAEALDAYSRTVAGVVERLAPSVASLRVLRATRRGRVPAGAGSAVVLTPDGFLLTSAHVVAGATARAARRFVDGREIGFRVVGADPLSDLAVLRATRDDLAPAVLGDAAACAWDSSSSRSATPTGSRGRSRPAWCRPSAARCPPARATRCA